MKDDFISQVHELLQSELPGEKAHQKLSPPGRKLKADLDAMEAIKYSSVLLLLFPIEGTIYTCLTRRNPNMKTHPGQISFPGGRIEEGEHPELTAIREAQEEVGIKPNDVRLLGQLSELYIPVSGYSIFPYVGWMDYRPDFVLNKEEAEELILLPIQQFLVEDKIKHVEMDTVRGRISVPYYPYQGEVIWGATAMILTEFFDVLKSGQLTL
ncbi:NUDIX hydrolase [Sunxiuqinia elliptica]|uniref:NUDIX domain-containing protein n=1 Tax=Sunxiuqinia elliptica TaxID=655355 RepID=A0A4R6H9F4_9BACT|nr:CoA pyrophosphatase [Sunxiuqinia elliptica]TDO04724.1 NUDIX domain-containing protein [Sunxiuqinia elliptica]TDO64272.1 NUDIX domain-containing protein [Sunxiuqinia elliptica]